MSEYLISAYSSHFNENIRRRLAEAGLPPHDRYSQVRHNEFVLSTEKPLTEQQIMRLKGQHGVIGVYLKL